MPLRLSQHAAPRCEPINLSEAKIHLRLAISEATAAAYTTEDLQLRSIISAARVAAETETWKSIVYQGLDLYLDEWPLIDQIELPMPPLRKVESIQYTDVDGEVRTFTDYTVDTVSEPGRIVLNDGVTWPSEDLRPNNPIRIRYWAGAVVPFTATASTNTINAPDHPFSDGDKVRLSFSGELLPTGLAVGTDYYVRDVTASTFKLSLTSGGTAFDFTGDGNGNLFIGERPANIIIGMLLLITDLYENRNDTTVATVTNIPRAASHWFAMDSAKRF